MKLRLSPKQRLRYFVVIALAVVLGAIGTLVIISSADKEFPQDLGNGVTTITAPPRKLTAETTVNMPPLQEGITAVSTVYKIGPSGKLDKPTWFRLPLNTLVPATHAVAVLTRPDGGQWQPITPAKTKLSNDRRFVEFETDHLSLFGAVMGNVEDLFNAFKKELIDGLSGNFLAEASPPRCKNEATVRDEGYQPRSSHSDTVYWCVGKEKDKVIVKVTNNRRYALIASYKNMRVIDKGKHANLFEMVARAGAGNRVVLFPRDTVIFSLDLKAGQAASLQTEMDGFANALFQLEAGLETAISLVSKFGKDDVGTVASLIGADSCRAALLNLIDNKGSSGEMIADCLDPAELYKLYGVKGFFVGIMATTGQFANFMRTAFNAVPDAVRGRDKYSLAVSRVEGVPFTYRGMTLLLPKEWRTFKPYPKSDLVILGAGDLEHDVPQTKPVFFMFGPTEQAHAESDVIFADGTYYGASGLKFCRGTQLTQHGNKILERKTVSIGGRQATYVHSRWNCGSGDSPPYKLVSTFEQRIWTLPKEKIWIVDEWSTPGLEDILAKATWN